MKPEASLPQVNPENFSKKESLSSIENLSNINTPELNAGERKEVFDGGEKSREEALNGSSSAAILPTPVIDSVAYDNNIQQATYPLIANDDDLIEKEWVDKAKKILADTKDDPYQREKEVGKLQVDYIKKRYGRELGEAA